MFSINRKKKKKCKKNKIKVRELTWFDLTAYVCNGKPKQLHLCFIELCYNKFNVEYIYRNKLDLII